MEIKDINPIITGYASRADEITNEEAMDILISLYIENCGISISDRTMAENAIHFWKDRWLAEHPELDMKDCGLYDLMQMRSEEYRKYKKNIDEYDITVLNAKELNRYTVQFQAELYDEKERIALCAGILNWLKDRIEFEEIISRNRSKEGHQDSQ